MPCPRMDLGEIVGISFDRCRNVFEVLPESESISIVLVLFIPIVLLGNREHVELIPLH